MDLPELLRVQDALGLRNTHLIAFARDGFAIAHTDAERARLGVFDLEDCALHVWALGVEPLDYVEGIYREGGAAFYAPWPNLVAFNVLSRSPIPRPKIAMRTEGVAAHDEVPGHTVTRGWSFLQMEGIVGNYNAMIDELEILSAALVAGGMNPKRILEAWRGER